MQVQFWQRQYIDLMYLILYIFVSVYVYVCEYVGGWLTLTAHPDPGSTIILFKSSNPGAKSRSGATPAWRGAQKGHGGHHGVSSESITGEYLQQF